MADADFEVMPTEVRVAAGTTAYLSCKPRSLRNKTVNSSLVAFLFVFGARIFKINASPREVNLCDGF